MSFKTILGRVKHRESFSYQAIQSLFRAFFSGFGGREAHVHEKLHGVCSSIRKQNGDPMKLVHMIGRVDSVSSAERAKHIGWQFEIHNVDYLVAVQAKLAPRHLHHDRIPLAIIFVTENCCFKILVKRIISRSAVCIKAMLKKLGLCHYNV